MSEQEKEWKLAVGDSERLDYCAAFNSNQLLNYNLRCRAFSTMWKLNFLERLISFQITLHYSQFFSTTQRQLQFKKRLVKPH